MGAWAAAPALPVPALQRLLIWKIEERGGPAGALFAPIRCRTHAYTSTKTKPLVQCAPGARAARSLPREPPPSSRSWDRGAALTGLGLTARVGNLLAWRRAGEALAVPCSIASTSSEEGLGQVLLSNTAGPVLSWALARARTAFLLSAWIASMRRNTPPGGSEFPFRWTVFKSLRCQVEGGRGWGCSRESVALAGCLPHGGGAPSLPSHQAWRAGCPQAGNCSNPLSWSLVSTGLACLRIPNESVAGLADGNQSGWRGSRPGAWIGWEY